MTPHCFVIDFQRGDTLPAEITPASQDDFAQTKYIHSRRIGLLIF